MRTRQVVAAELAAKHTEQKGLLDKGEALTAEDLQRAEALETEITALEAEVATFDAADAMRARSATRQTAMQTAVMPVPFAAGGQPASTALALPARPAAIPLPMGYQSRHIVFQAGPGPDGSQLSGYERAYRFGSWILATLGSSAKSQDYCRRTGIPLAYLTGDNQLRMLTGIGGVEQFAHVENVNAAGGYAQ